jgi:glycerol dehydrogenase-like iron-containing ADH family enzyme
MCDPVTVAIASIQAYGQVQQGRIARRNANAEADALEQQAAVQRTKDTKVMIGVGIGVVALIGGALIYRRSR